MKFVEQLDLSFRFCILVKIELSNGVLARAMHSLKVDSIRKRISHRSPAKFTHCWKKYEIFLFNMILSINNLIKHSDSITFQ